MIAAVADFNNDGKPDIATDSGYVLLGVGNGNFTLKGEEYPEYPGPANSLVAADFNHDGKIDIATVNKWRDIARDTAWKDYGAKTPTAANLLKLATNVSA